MQISVVIPLYNKKDSISRALCSVINQALSPDEIIIVDDGCTDGSDKIVEEINHPLVTLIHQKNAGVSAARNTGVEKAKNEWIAFLDADDEWKIEYLQNIVELQKKFPNSSLLGSSYFLRKNDRNEELPILKGYDFEGEMGVIPDYFKFAVKSSLPPIWTSAVVVRKADLLSIKGFPVGVKSGEDLLTWAKLASIKQLAYVCKPLVIYHLELETKHNSKNRFPEKHDLVGDELTKLAVDSHSKYVKIYLAKWKRIGALRMLHYGEKKLAIQFLLRSIDIYPSKISSYIMLLIMLLAPEYIYRALLLKHFDKK